VVGELVARLVAGVTSGLRVGELWRYPVKSLLGERLARAEVGPEGIDGDRQWALFDLGTGFGLTARRVPDLLFASARLGGPRGVEVVLPDGTVTGDDATISGWLGRPVTLRAVAETDGRPRYESLDDDLAEPDGGTGDGTAVPGWHSWRGGAGAFHDDPAARLTLVSTATLGSWDRRRFRANVVLEGAGEDDLIGRRIALGEAVLSVGEPVPRCVMVTRPQPGGIARDTGVLKTIHRERGGLLAVGAAVERPGPVGTGDAVVVLD
jgi:uncharacterized protein YcbX